MISKDRHARQVIISDRFGAVGSVVVLAVTVVIVLALLLL